MSGWRRQKGVAVGTLLRLLSILLALDVGMLDGQAPDVEVIAYRNDDINYEAAVHPESGTQHKEHEGNLVHTIAESARPASTDMLEEDRTQRVEDAVGERQAEDVPVREAQLDEVRRDHLAHAVSVDDTCKHGKRHQVIAENVGLQVKIRDDHGPHGEEGDETEESTSRSVAAGASCPNHIERRLVGVEDEDNGALDQRPLAKGHLVDQRRNNRVLWNSERAEQALLPNVAAAHIPGNEEDYDDDQDALDRTVDDTKGKGLGVVFVPGLDVERKQRFIDLLAHFSALCITI